MRVMLALRYLYVLALVVWLGGMVVLGAIIAPATFQVLQARAPEIGRALDALGRLPRNNDRIGRPERQRPSDR